MQRSLSGGSREIEPNTCQWEWSTGIMSMSYLGPRLSITGWSWKNVIKKWGWPMLGPWCPGNGKWYQDIILGEYPIWRSVISAGCNILFLWGNSLLHFLQGVSKKWLQLSQTGNTSSAWGFHILPKENPLTYFEEVMYASYSFPEWKETKFSPSTRMSHPL